MIVLPPLGEDRRGRSWKGVAWNKGLGPHHGKIEWVALVVVTLLAATILWSLHRPPVTGTTVSSLWPDLAIAALFAGAVLGLSLAIRRMTRTRAELSRERRLLHSLLKYLPDRVYFKDRDSRFIRVNKALAERHGLPDPAQLIGKTDFDFFTEEHARPAFADEQEIMRTLQPIVDKEEKETWADGRVGWVATTKAALRDVSGQVIGTFGISRDITEAKEAEIALRESEQRTRLIVDTAYDAFVGMDAAGKITEWNRQAERTFGWTRAEVLGKTVAETVVPPQFREPHTIGLARFLQTGEGPVLNRRIEIVALHHDGNEVPVELTIAPIRLGEQYLFGAFVRDITERKLAEEELRRAKEAAESASQAKSEFLANMSHELRTPMHGILGMTQLALDTDLNRDQREYLSMVKLSAEALLALINDILDFSKIEARKLLLDAVDFSLRDSLGDMIKALGLRAQQKGLELTCHVPPEVPDAVTGDCGRLQQIIVNLVGNAIKFTESGEVDVEVEVESRTEEEVCLHFMVSDTGIGIPAEKQASIFEAFTQADASTTRQYGGTGLGLTISSRLVEMMGGRIWIVSQTGAGSTFHFTARFKPAASTAASRGLITPASLLALPVLVVDDNATNRRILHEMLTAWRMKPTVVDGAPAALAELHRALAQGEPFPLAVLDAMMPGMDGFALAAEIKQHPELARAVLMMLSSGGQATDTDRCRQLGINVYLAKPVKQSELLDAILNALDANLKEEVPPMPAELSPGKRRLHILLAEDNLVNQRLAVRLLEKRGHAVVVANNGKEALDLLSPTGAASAPFDLVLMDVQMPEMGGLEAAALIRDGEAGTGLCLPIFAMTAHALKGDRERCLQSGMDDYISKPVCEQELFETIARRFPDCAITDGMTPTRVRAIEAELDVSAALDQVGGDVKLLKELVAIFLETTPGLVANLRQAAAAGDLQGLRLAAHTLRGAAGGIGAHSFAVTAGRLETLACERNLTQASAVRAELEAGLERLRPQLQRLRDHEDRHA